MNAYPKIINSLLDVVVHLRLAEDGRKAYSLQARLPYLYKGLIGGTWFLHNLTFSSAYLMVESRR